MGILRRLFDGGGKSDGERLARGLQQLLAGESWNEARAVLTAHPELLEPRALDLLDRLGEQRPTLAPLIADHRALLVRCRHVGVDRAISERIARDEPPAELQPILNDIWAAQREHARARDAASIERVISGWQQVLGAARFATSPNAFRAHSLWSAASAYVQRYRVPSVGGDLDDLDRAIDLAARASQLHSENSGALADCLATLGGASFDRYQRTGAQGDLERAAEAMDKAFDMTSVDSPDRAMYGANLAKMLMAIYDITDDETLLELAADRAAQAVNKTLPQDPTFSGRAMHLSHILHTTFVRTRDWRVLDEAVSAAEAARRAAHPSRHEEIDDWLSRLQGMRQSSQ